MNFPASTDSFASEAFTRGAMLRMLPDLLRQQNITQVVRGTVPYTRLSGWIRDSNNPVATLDVPLFVFPAGTRILAGTIGIEEQFRDAANTDGALVGAGFDATLYAVSEPPPFTDGSATPPSGSWADHFDFGGAGNDMALDTGKAYWLDLSTHPLETAPAGTSTPWYAYPYTVGLRFSLPDSKTNPIELSSGLASLSLATLAMRAATPGTLGNYQIVR